MKRYERVYAKIDLDAITDNMKRIREKLPESVNLFAVVKRTWCCSGGLCAAGHCGWILSGIG